MKPRIAVVEDNPDNRLLVRALLEPTYEVVEYETGPQFLADLGQQRLRMVLLDISLPEMDGVEILRWIRGQEALQALPVVALTAHAMAGDREKYLAMGFDDYLSKPIVDDLHFLDLVKRWAGPGA